MVHNGAQHFSNAGWPLRGVCDVNAQEAYEKNLCRSLVSKIDLEYPECKYNLLHFGMASSYNLTITDAVSIIKDYGLPALVAGVVVVIVYRIFNFMERTKAPRAGPKLSVGNNKASCCSVAGSCCRGKRYD